jgi:hypothetical protein
MASATWLPHSPQLRLITMPVKHSFDDINPASTAT